MMDLQGLLKLEEQLILNEITTNGVLPNTPSNNLLAITSDRKQEHIATKSITEIAETVHKTLIMRLIASYTDGMLKPWAIEYYFEEGKTLEPIKDVQKKIIPSLCEDLHIAFLNSAFDYDGIQITRKKSKENLIETGAVYTKKNIVNEIAEQTISNVVCNGKSPRDLKLLDFACGTGRFYEQIIEILYSQYGIGRNDAVLNNVYAIDIDPVAVNIARLKAISFLNKPTDADVEQISKHIIRKNALIKAGGLLDNPLSLQINDLDGLTNAGFDAILSNPPYLVLKINSTKGDEKMTQRIKQQVDYFRKSGAYKYSIEGMLNFYQISIEAMLQMAKEGGELGIICPSSLFADTSSTKLRKHLLLHNKLHRIKYFPEKEKLFDNVSQATNIFYLQKNGSTDSIQVETNGEAFQVYLSEIKQIFPDNMEIPIISRSEWEILKKLAPFYKLSQLKNIRNRRGELDLTLYKQYITKTKTEHRLVRGNMISEAGIKDINGEYVFSDFLTAKSGDYINNDFGRKRLVCQQISNCGLQKRLKFVLCENTDILANSCNYLSSDEQTLKKLRLLLNSSILNWRFKLTSSNNHINNYELDDLPMVNLDKVDANFNYQTQSQLDTYVASLYELSNNELETILSK